jgi:hypothetical protein
MEEVWTEEEKQRKKKKKKTATIMTKKQLFSRTPAHTTLSGIKIIPPSLGAVFGSWTERRTGGFSDLYKAKGGLQRLHQP